MELQYETDFLESALFLCIRRRNPPVPPAQVTRFHAERERVYRVLEPGTREQRFHEVYVAWFREWGLEERWHRIWREMPQLERQLSYLVICRPRAGWEPGVELYMNREGGPSAVLVLPPERLFEDTRLEAFLRHEFTHLADMLDPEFGYDPDEVTARVPAGLERLVRERYRLLWDITIDGRLAAAGHPVETSRETHAGALARAFPFWSEERRAEVLARLWSREPPRHAELVAWASDPRCVRAQKGPAPGAACPLCGFPTFEWADPHRAQTLEPWIREDAPWWAAGLGLCGRCAELYEARRWQRRYLGAA
jgi:hypothetical protein